MVQNITERLPDSEDEFTREAAGITLRFVWRDGIPNKNWYDVYTGRRNIGYICLPPFSGNWAAICNETKNRDHFNTRKEAEDYMVRQIEYIMNSGGVK